MGERGFFSVQEAAQWAGVSPRTLQRWILRGLPTYQTGPHTKVLIRLQDIEAFLVKRQAPKPVLNIMVDEVFQDLQGRDHA